jgi:hypothetical protein
VRLGPSLLSLAAAAVASFAAAALPLPSCERAAAAGELVDELYAQPSGGPSNDATQRLKESGDSHTAEYGFTNFNRDRLELKFAIKKAAFKEYEENFGYSAKEIAAIKAWREKARKDAFAKAVASGKSQAQLDAAVGAVQRDYQRKLTDYLSLRGFRLSKDNVVRVDIPRLIRDHAAKVGSAAEQLDAVARKKSYESEDLVGAALSLVQTALIYHVPPAVEGDVHTGGMAPPVKALVRGWGDCDSKSALMGSILKHWPSIRLLGVAVPEHYLLAVLRSPGKGDAFVEYEGSQYVLVEPAGPAWLPPGRVASSTMALLEGQDGYKLEPLF